MPVEEPRFTHSTSADDAHLCVLGAPPPPAVRAAPKLALVELASFLTTRSGLTYALGSHIIPWPNVRV